MTFKKFKSLAFLGRHIAVHFLNKLLGRKSPGLESFLENYRRDKITSVDLPARRDMPAFSHCHTCRLCDTICPPLALEPGRLSPSYVVSTFSRSLPDYAYFEPGRFECGSCRQCEEICPQDVPIRRIADFMKTQAQNLGRLSSEAAPSS